MNFLKIAGPLISDFASGPVDRSMVQAIGKVGRALGIATVAESAESAELLAARERIGADFAQRDQMARPRPLAELAP